MSASIYDALIVRFGGERPAVQCWSPTQYRVAYHGWHCHDGAMSGSPFGDGKTLEKACKALLVYIDRPQVETVRGDCDQSCCNRYSASPKAKIERENFWKFVEDAAARVDRWPAWKRGLPPCATDNARWRTGIQDHATDQPFPALRRSPAGRHLRAGAVPLFEME